MTLPTATRHPPCYPSGAFRRSRKAVNWPASKPWAGLFIQLADKLRAYHADANEAGPHAAAVVAAQAVVDTDDEDIGG